MPEAAASKVCTKCGIDVAGKPRVKDPRGRYLCQPCFDAVSAVKTEARTPAAAPSPKPATAASVPADEGIFGMVDLDALKPVADAPKPRELKVCAACGKARDKDSVVCVNCGFDERAGFQRGTGVGASARKGGKTACPGCGYDLKGLKKPRCPECGKVLPLVTEREEREAESKQIARKAWIKPLVLLGIGLAGLCIVGTQRGGGGGAGVAAELVEFAVGLPVAGLVYVICGFMWLGFDAPPLRATVSLAGAYAAADLLSSVFDLMPIRGMYLTIAFYVGTTTLYGYLLGDLLDMETQDGFIVAVLTWLAQLFAIMFIAALILQALK